MSEYTKFTCIFINFGSKNQYIQGQTLEWDIYAYIFFITFESNHKAFSTQLTFCTGISAETRVWKAVVVFTYILYNILLTRLE